MTAPEEPTDGRPLTRLGEWFDAHYGRVRRLPRPIRKQAERVRNIAIARNSQAYYRATYDAKANEDTAVPADELLSLPFLCAVELFTPSTINNLMAAVADLDWLRGFAVGGDDLGDWIIDQRQRGGLGGAWVSLARLKPVTSATSDWDAIPGPLPGGVFESAHPRLIVLTPSLTALSVIFWPTDDAALSIDAALREEAQTVTEVTPNGGAAIHDVRQVKEQRYLGARTDLRDAATTFLRQHLPGEFAGGLLDNRYPTVEFVVTAQAEPFAAVPQGERPPNYMRLGGLAEFWAWRCTEIPGLSMSIERSSLTGNPATTLTLAARERDVWADRDLTPYGTEDRRKAIARRLSSNYVDGLATRWALSALLAGADARLADLRDVAHVSAAGNAVSLERLSEDLLRNGLTAQSVAADVIALTRAKRWYHRDVLSFEFADPDPKFKSSQPESLRVSQVSAARRIQKADRDLRDVLNTASQLRAAGANLRVQAALIVLGVLSTLAAVIAAIAAIAALKQH